MQNSNLNFRMINFMKYKWLYFVVSALVIVPGLISLSTFGLKLGVDFTGGVRWELQFEKDVDAGQLQKIIGENGVVASSVVSSGEKRYLIKAKSIEEEKRGTVKEIVEKEFGKATELRFELVGPLLGRELLNRRIYFSSKIEIILN